jgi:predicted O-methyltransferase YrrM
MSDIVDHPEDYFRQFIPPRDPFLQAMESEAIQDEIPIVGPVVGHLLYLLACVSGAQRILELGTATGYSAIFLARAIHPDKGRLITIECDEAMAAVAQANIQKAGVAQRVQIRCADALKEVKRMAGGFDLVFIDIEKEDYLRVLPDCHNLLNPGGLFIADNVAFKDADPFNRAIAGASEWRAVHLFSFLPQHSPEYDGLCLAVRI